MSDATTPGGGTARPRLTKAVLEKSLRRRYAAERRFKLIGLGAVVLGLLLVALLFVTIIQRGYSAFVQSHIQAEVYFDPEVLTYDPPPQESDFDSYDEYEAAYFGWQGQLNFLNWNALIQEALLPLVPEAADDPSALVDLVTRAQRNILRDMVIDNPEIRGETVEISMIASAYVDIWIKDNIDREVVASREESTGSQIFQLGPQQRVWADELYASGDLTLDLNWGLLFNVDSRSTPATAGLAGAFIGSLYMMLIVLVLAVPIGVAASIYLEEFAPKNRWTDMVEVNINNLAAVPSIVFGLLGAAIFINWFGLPISAPLVGGLVLTLMTLPTIIIATRAALKAVPPSIREAALGVGASRMQAMFHHTLPLAFPGILTGAIIGLAQALGETAPLLLIGMKAFVADIPSTPLEQSTALPVQIYLWQGNELRNFFEERTSAAIMVLLALMITLNALAIWLRRRFERRW